MEERRAENRCMCADMIEVHWLDGCGHSCSVKALLEDIAPSGACLQTETSLPVGVEVQCNCGAHQFIGRTRYCAYREIGYFTGVEFSAATPWSRQEYAPRHLLDLDALMPSSWRRPPNRAVD